MARGSLLAMTNSTPQKEDIVPKAIQDIRENEISATTRRGRRRFKDGAPGSPLIDRRPWGGHSIRMDTTRIRIALALGAAAVIPLATGAERAAAQSPEALPIYTVKNAGASPQQAQRLARALDLPGEMRESNGTLSFVSKHFGDLPSHPVEPPRPVDEEGTPVVAEAPDLAAIKALKPIDDATARERATKALRDAGLRFSGPGTVTHSEFESFDGKETFTAQVDTHVSFPRRLEGLPLIGAGEKSKLIFDPDGNVSYLRFATRELSRGESVPVIPPADADRLAAARYRGGCPGKGGLTDLKLERKLVYFAPSLEQDAARIVPHYSYTGTAKSGGEEISLNGIFVPAIHSTGLSARLEAHAEGGRIVASTTPLGGRGPYEYRYGSCATTIDDAAATPGRDTSFALKARNGSVPSQDTVSVTVTDADGLTTVASASVDVPAQARTSAARRPRARASAAGAISVATEWIGNTQGIPNGYENARDFRNEMDDVSSIAFNWGDNDVWDTDFTDSALAAGGDDDTYVDNTDLVWYEGHGNSTSFNVGTTFGDGDVSNSETRWGNNDDLEWLALMSCNVLLLNSVSGHVWDRWGPSFDGLHLLMGFGSTAFDVSGMGNNFGDGLADDDEKVRTAWVDASEAEQPNGVIYRYMGVYGANGEWNREDYFHGIGSVSADIYSPTGYWSYSGTV